MRGRLSLVVVLVLSVFASLLPAATASAETESPDVWEPPATTRTDVVGGDPTATAPVLRHPEPITDTHVELASFTTATQTSTTSVSPNGGYVTEIYPGPVNFLNDAGAWEPIDNTLVSSSEPGYALENAAGDHRLLLPSDVADAPVKLEHDGRWVGFGLDGAASSAPTAEGERAVYPSVLPGVDAAYTATNLGVKEDLILASPSATSTFRFTVETSLGLVARETAEGGIQFVDATGAAAFGFAPPYMADSADDGGAVSDAVTLSIVQTLPTLVVELDADRGWLEAPERVFPVMVDPTINRVDPYIDAHINSSSYNSNFGASTTMKVGRESGINRGLVQFTLPVELRRPNVIRSSELSFNVASTAPLGSSAFSVSAYGLVGDFTEGGVTWNKRNSTEAWTTPGGDLHATKDSSTTVGGTVLGRQRWFVTRSLQSFVDDGRTRAQFAMRADDEATTRSVRLSSGEATSTDWPKLVVEWEPLLGLADKYGYESFDIGETRSVHVNVADGNLVVHERDMTLKGIGLDAKIERFYNSRSTYAYDFGNRWQAVPQTAARLYLQESGDIAYYRDGIQLFTKNANGTFTPPAKVNKTLKKTASGFELTHNASGVTEKFDTRGYLLSIVDRNNNTISLKYDPSTNRVSSMQDTRGNTTVFTRNSKGRIEEVVDPTGTRKHRYVFKLASDELREYWNPQGRKTQYDYTSGGDLIGINDADNTKTSFTYDTADRVTSVTLATNQPGEEQKWLFAYSTSARTTKVTDPRGNVTTHHWDTQGRVTKVVDAKGRERSTGYDSNSNVLDHTRKLGGTPFTLEYSQDGRNNLTKATTPTGAYSEMKYELAAFPFLPSSVTDGQGNQVTYGYDARGNRESVTANDGQSAITTKTVHNPNGTVAYIEDGKNNRTTYTYNSKGDLTKIAPPAPIAATTMTYDTVGRLRTATDPNGNTVQYFYDVMDRTTKIVAPGQTIYFYYNPVGKKTTRSAYDSATGNVKERTTYRYDRLGHLLEETHPTYTVSYTYDPVGNLKTVTDTTGTVTYTHNSVNELEWLTDQDNATTSFTYDDSGNRDVTTYPNGVTLDADYDASERLQAIVGKNPLGTVLTSFSYDYTDPIGGGDTMMRQRVTDAAGRTTDYDYDGLNRLIDATTTGSGGGVLDARTWTFDAASNRETQTANGTTTHYAYNAANQLCWTGAAAGTCGAAPAGATTFSYDAAGNEIARSTGFQAGYNGLNQTTSITPSAGAPAVSFDYSGTSQLERTRSGDTSFTNGLLGVHAEQPSAGPRTSWVRDDAGTLVAKRTVTGTTTEKWYYLFDGLGSVVGLTDGTGQLVNSYRYDPYGVPLETIEATANPWQFVGEYHDAATGLYKIGHRYYDPTIGRWTQADPSRAEANPYAYVGCNPVNRVDPSGLRYVSACVWGMVHEIAPSLLSYAVSAIFTGGSSLWYTGAEILAGCLEGIAQELGEQYLTGMVANALDGYLSAERAWSYASTFIEYYTWILNNT